MKGMRPSTFYLVLVGTAGLLLLALLLVLPPLGAGQKGQEREERRSLVARLGLTDLCLFSEARYTRHPSQADLHSAFQDHPLAMEHFPSGSLVRPPAHLTGQDVPKVN
jgi:hypothetical protein